MALAVALGAFGAHALESRVSPHDLQTWKTATHYHALHALSLVALGSVMFQTNAPRLSVAAVLFIVGISIFAGSLYVLVLSGVRWLGAVTPVGGLALIAGWLIIAFTALPVSGE